MADGVVFTSALDALRYLHPRLRGRLLLATDFDGTISRLSMEMWQVAVIPAAQRALRRLAASPDTAVAFVSGRTLTDLAPRVRVGGATYHGDHGAEWAIAARGFRATSLHVEREPVDPVVTAMADRLKVEVPRLVGADWLVVEDKGPALTFHFRRAPDIERSSGPRARSRRHRWTRIACSTSPADVERGRCVPTAPRRRRRRWLG